MDFQIHCFPCAMATLVLLNNISVIPKFVKNTVISILKQYIMLVNSRKIALIYMALKPKLEIIIFYIQ